MLLPGISDFCSLGEKGASSCSCFEFTFVDGQLAGCTRQSEHSTITKHLLTS